MKLRKPAENLTSSAELTQRQRSARGRRALVKAALPKAQKRQNLCVVQVWLAPEASIKHPPGNIVSTQIQRGVVHIFRGESSTSRGDALKQ